MIPSTASFCQKAISKTALSQAARRQISASAAAL
eukprot:CAMPEP_0172525474 /NCGR_PEP_ID=MMETSP1067-20121228/507_1 /TAXON_ID=265564 ORGANISM="Thalassiosira punctigera, Strain Tpunct2005C2" /NCGR_SAMPLE_ID=MMETSP1067 /ASSEMBLY_ACC=CAM_ASM_000444 /LENGTH=33 /DNA_ID= /DNA_START= /DNA_END= /DNA_ORIENTATION=